MAKSKLNMIDRLLEKVSAAYDNLNLLIAGIVLVTIGFACFIPRVQILTIFSDLLPQNHEYIKTYDQYKDYFGSANFVTISVKVKNGDIYNKEYFDKIKMITDGLNKIDNINHDSVLSLTTKTLRNVGIRQDGAIVVRSIYEMFRENESQLDKFKESIHRMASVYGPIVSLNDKSSLIVASFYEDRIDYNVAFKEMEQVCKQAEDNNVSVYITGYPVLMGYIYKYRKEMLLLFAASLVIILGLTYLKFKSVGATLVPVIVLFLSMIWGVGVIGIFNYNLDPLVFLIPLLLSSRAISHSTQVTSRYYEYMAEFNDNVKAAKKTWKAMAIPGIVGILSDAFGIYFLCLTGVPFLSKVGYYCGTWAVLLIFDVILVTPALLAKFNFKTKERNTIYKRSLTKLGTVTSSNRYLYGNFIFWGIVIVIAFPFFWNVQIGDTRPGSPLLWPDSNYNQSAKEINESYFGDNKMILVVSKTDKGVLKDPVALRTMDDFAKNYVSGLQEAGGSKSITDVVKYMNRIFHANDPKWAVIPNRQNDVASFIFQYMIGAGVPDALREYVDDDYKNASLTIYLKDSMGATISKAVNRLDELKEQEKYKNLDVKVMGGNIGVFAAINEYLESKNVLVQTVVTFAIFLIVLGTYRNLTICIIAILPVFMANIITLGFMRLKGIGVGISTLPVISIGAGIGIDYTIYVLDRLLHEFDLSNDGDFSLAETIRTTGRAVLFTASTMVLSLVIWYVSDVRFIAEMGMLLALMFLVHASTALFLIPCMVKQFYFKRKLASKTNSNVSWQLKRIFQ